MPDARILRWPEAHQTTRIGHSGSNLSVPGLRAFCRSSSHKHGHDPVWRQLRTGPAHSDRSLGRCSYPHPPCMAIPTVLNAAPKSIIGPKRRSFAGAGSVALRPDFLQREPPLGRLNIFHRILCRVMKYSSCQIGTAGVQSRANDECQRTTGHGRVDGKIAFGEYVDAPAGCSGRTCV
jgi:hypothetical protein